MSNTQWVKYDGSDKQIAEIWKANKENGFITVWKDGNESGVIVNDWNGFDKDIDKYWIIPDDPLRKMKIRQAETGQPIWTRQKSMLREGEWFYLDPTTAPPWFMEDAEFSFKPFQESENVSGE